MVGCGKCLLPVYSKLNKYKTEMRKEAEWQLVNRAFYYIRGRLAHQSKKGGMGLSSVNGDVCLRLFEVNIECNGDRQLRSDGDQIRSEEQGGEPQVTQNKKQYIRLGSPRRMGREEPGKAD